MSARRLILQSHGWIRVTIFKVSGDSVVCFRGKIMNWNGAVSRHSVFSGTETPRVESQTLNAHARYCLMQNESEDRGRGVRERASWGVGMTHPSTSSNPSLPSEEESQRLNPMFSLTNLHKTLVFPTALCSKISIHVIINTRLNSHGPTPSGLCHLDAVATWLLLQLPCPLNWTRLSSLYVPNAP